MGSTVVLDRVQLLRGVCSACGNHIAGLGRAAHGALLHVRNRLKYRTQLLGAASFDLLALCDNGPEMHCSLSGVLEQLSTQRRD
jgi:hypothetical protein